MRLMTIHALTGGRFTLGVGAGSTQADFDACDADFSERFRLFAQYLPLIRKLCNGEVVGSANLNPPENARGGPPMMIGSWNSKLWIRRAATQYEGWLASGRADTNQFQTLGENLKMFRDLGGKRVAIATVGIDLTQPNKRLAPDEAFNLRCGPESAVERLQMVAKMGVDDVFLAAQTHTLNDLPVIRALLPVDVRDAADLTT
jgi:hypothetical protein